MFGGPTNYVIVINSFRYFARRSILVLVKQSKSDFSGIEKKGTIKFLSKGQWTNGPTSCLSIDTYVRSIDNIVCQLLFVCFWAVFS